MDHINIPSFAMLRYGTVITRLRNLNMESFLPTCGQLFPEGCTRVVHRVSRCEQCTRTRIVSQCSDCDSELVGKCRPYRTRAAKSRYVNVCAAVCLLLLVGGLTPSSAAPHRWRTMDEKATEQENETWSNPCDYNESVLNPSEYKPELATKVARQAGNLHPKVKDFRNLITKIHGYEAQDFKEMVEYWKGRKWLRDQPWFTNDILPEGKEIGTPASDEYLKTLMTKEKIDELLPLFSKAMKLLSACLRSVSNAMKDPLAYSGLKRNFMATSIDVREILCHTSEVIHARKLQMLPLYDSEIPTYASETNIDQDVFLIYRDTLNFLEYIEQFFDKMSQTVLE